VPERARNYTIRPARAADAPRIGALYGDWMKLAPEMAVGQQLQTDTDWTRYFGSKLGRDDMCVFVAEVDNAVTAFIVGRAGNTGQADFINRAGKVVRRVLGRRNSRLAKPRKVGVIDHVYIDPDVRNPYLGYDLLNACLDWFKGKGLTAAEGVVWSLNDTTLRVAKFLGFKPIRVMLRKELE
jgi:ribosomal protein S18 acetylase RimI-like enzyme